MIRTAKTAKTATKTTPANTASRNAQLRESLEGRKRSIQADLRRGVRGARTQPSNDTGDEGDRSDANTTEGLDFALLQMKTETVRRIEQALERLDSGAYGSCASCERDISETRLLALPFALRCKDCEALREQRETTSRRTLDQAGFPAFSALGGL